MLPDPELLGWVAFWAVTAIVTVTVALLWSLTIAASRSPQRRTDRETATPAVRAHHRRPNPTPATCLAPLCGNEATWRIDGWQLCVAHAQPILRKETA